MARQTIDGGVIDAKGIRELKLISDLEDSCLQSSSYDLRLGPAHFVYAPSDQGDAATWKRCFVGRDMSAFNKNDPTGGEPFARQNNNDINALTIPARGAAFVQLHETVDTLSVTRRISRMVVGRFDLRLRWVNAGLISQQATQVEPFYKGKLFCFVYNLSNEDIRIEYLDRFATIEFSYGASGSRSDFAEWIEKSRRKYASRIGTSGNGITDIRYFSSSVRLPVQSGLFALESGLRSEIKDVEVSLKDEFEGESTRLKNDAKFIESVSQLVDKRMTAHVNVKTTIITAVASVLSAVIMAGLSYCSMDSRVAQLEENVAAITETQAETYDTTQESNERG